MLLLAPWLFGSTPAACGAEFFARHRCAVFLIIPAFHSIPPRPPPPVQQPNTPEIPSMTSRKLLPSACALIIVLIGLSAQEFVQPASIGNSLQSAVIISGSGATRPLRTQPGYVGRVGLAPNQLVTVALQFPEEFKDKRVIL